MSQSDLVLLNVLPFRWRLYVAKVFYRMGIRTERVVWYYELNDRERVRKIGMPHVLSFASRPDSRRPLDRRDVH